MLVNTKEMELRKENSLQVKPKSLEEKAQEASTLVDSIILIGTIESELCKIIDNKELLSMDVNLQKQIIDAGVHADIIS
jgi:hypothetical protein